MAFFAFLPDYALKYALFGFFGVLFVHSILYVACPSFLLRRGYIKPSTPHARIEPRPLSKHKLLNNVFNKVEMYFRGWFHIMNATMVKSQFTLYALFFAVFSNEGRKTRTQKLQLTPENSNLAGKKTVYLFRHGESKWNYCFNRKLGPGIFARLLMTFGSEFFLFPYLDSEMLDSPLSDMGVDQAIAVRDFLRSAPDAGDAAGEHVNVLLGGPSAPESVIVSSNLRRAISTVLIGFSDRIAKTNESVAILSSIQEMTRNIDGISMAPALSVPPVPHTETGRLAKQVHRLASLEKPMHELYEASLDPSDNQGNKPFSSRISDRIRQFADWCFDAEKCKKPVVIIGGHSGFFKHLLRKYLPANVQHPGKETKISNCGIVKVEIQKLQLGDQTGYYIDPQSIEEIHGGFITKKGKAKPNKVAA
uniref:Uncharacterized protein n=1 Tax=Chromera velia CCMP2878 TaxID=1169474 RepID=A0A0G4GW00_9ALVE|eukprot:Cvel_23637.t1-p1 / transcript=Cvel_23637.t1 / gene=Cvel_23637 / organism=Chromera_velia_CCMP2878 / gene_product=hypothetical protein / transcript_product=hypothetical protein / location=Cvel_scaffold2458:9405-13590(-) / protein_length=419 / sequence_SO=supercontig / SO=protein_coding / is_pseudo=false